MKLPSTLLVACAMLFNLNVGARELPPITPVAHVDLPRFMGDWYVIATIPTRFEKHAYDAVEVYTLKPDGHVATSFHFRDGSFDGERKDIHSTGFVKPGSGNAVWGVQVFGPRCARLHVGDGAHADHRPGRLRRPAGAGAGAGLPDGQGAQGAAAGTGRQIRPLAAPDPRRPCGTAARRRRGKRTRRGSMRAM